MKLLFEIIHYEDRSKTMAIKLVKQPVNKSNKRFHISNPKCFYVRNHVGDIKSISEPSPNSLSSWPDMVLGTKIITY